MNEPQDFFEDEIDLRVYISTLIRWWKLLVLSTFIAVGIGYCVSLYIPPTYEATATLMVGRLSQSSDLNLSEINTAIRLAKIYAAISTKEVTLQKVINFLNIEDLTWQQLKKKVKVNVVPETQLFEITVQASTAKQAQRIANALAEQVIEQSPNTLAPEEQDYYALVENQLSQLYSDIENTQETLKTIRQKIAVETDPIEKHNLETDAENNQSHLITLQNNYATLLNTINNAQSFNQLSIIDKASLPDTPVSPRPMLNSLIAGAINLMLSIFAIFAWEYINNTIKNSDDVYQKLNLTTLGSIPENTTTNSPTTLSTNVFRALRTNIQFSSLLTSHPAKTFLITSSIENEGKSTTAANLATAMANADKRVILIDSDSYKPTLHQLFNVPNHIGWSNFILHQTPLYTTLQNTHTTNLKIITSGPIATNIADFLSPERLKEGIDMLANYADIILFDGPPLLPVSDSRILATQIDVTLLVIKAQSTRTSICTQSINILEQIGVKPLGAILNGVKREHNRYYYNSYYSSYHQPEHNTATSDKNNTRLTHKWLTRLQSIFHPSARS